MRWLADYIRQVFCKHDFEVNEYSYTVDGTFSYRQGVKVLLRCKKCGYHKKYWKY